jgi:hypothetical protein
LHTRNQVAIIDDDRGYRMDFRIRVKAFAPVCLVGVLVTSTNRARSLSSPTLPTPRD